MWAVAACGGTVLAAEPLTIALLRRLAVLDMPGGRSSHSVPTPRGGGAPIAVGLIAAVLIAPGAGDARPALAAAIGFFGLLGLLDDLRGLPALSRLLLQAAGGAGGRGGARRAAVAACASRWPSAVAAVAGWLVGFVNAFNFMDGVNGISGAHALIGGVCRTRASPAWRRDAIRRRRGPGARRGRLRLPALERLAGPGSSSATWAATRSAAALAVLAARLVMLGVSAEAVAGPVALYLADVAWTLQRRIRRGERWLEAHRTHVYQRWCDAGWSHPEVTVLTSALTVLLCLLGVLGLRGGMAVRAGADLAGLAALAAYLCSPGLFPADWGRLEVRVLIVTHYFPPETGAPQARLSALAAAWAADGDDVTVLTGMPNHPTGVLPPMYRRAVLRRERGRRLPGHPHLAVRHAATRAWCARP